MKERPILFSAPMVRAILDGTKTQTRRIVNMPKLKAMVRGTVRGDFPFSRREAHGQKSAKIGGAGAVCVKDNTGDWLGVKPGEFDFICPYADGETILDCEKWNIWPKDSQLWVKETFWAFGRWETRFSEKKHRDEWHFVDLTADIGETYRFEGGPSEPSRTSLPEWRKRPSIFMPRVASRITLEIVSVRVERLQNISGKDCAAEGCKPDWDALYDEEEGYYDDDEPEEFIEACEEHCDWVNYGSELVHSSEHREWVRDRTIRALRLAYKTLWESINGPGSWDANPWVWVIEFKHCADLPGEDQ